jgi:enoyl-CoA hydratase/carnithine racemase
MRDYARIKVARDGGVEIITLNNPDKRNAIGPRMTNELLWALEDARAAADVRSIVLTGEGKAFCAGGDFSEMTSGAAESKLAHKGDYADLLLALAKTDKPVIARRSMWGCSR